MVNLKQVLKLINERTKLIDSIIEAMEKEVGAAQADLLRGVVEGLVDKLDHDEDGRIKNTLANKRKIALVDTVYQKYLSESGIKIVESIVTNVDKVMNFNGRYFSMFTGKAELGKILGETKTIIGDWLGITNRGGLVENGYLKTLLTDPTIRNTVRDSVFKSVISQKGFFETKAELGNYIAGNKEQTGSLQKYYRNFVYDTFNQVDRAQSKIFSDRLKLKYAIYEGGIIKTSRKWCIDRNGKVFTTEEIQKFDPPVAKQPNYDPFTDLGGYSCRHHLNYIPEILAFALRPELRNKA